MPQVPKSSLPIQLPARISSTDRVFAKWADEVVSALQALRDRGNGHIIVPRLPSKQGTERFSPYVGGEAGTTLFITPGTVTYLRVALEDFSVGQEGIANQQAIPKFPVIGETRIDEEEPEGLDLTDRSSCSVWLITDRSKCPNPTTGTPEGDDSTLAPERIEIYEKTEKPERRDEELHRLLCTMDFDTSDSGRKSIKNLKRYIACDQDVWFLCEDDTSSFDDISSLGSSDVGSSEETDESDSSGDSKDCPWAMVASWQGKATCYREYSTPLIGWRVAVGISTLFSRCQRWEAHVTFESATPIPFAGQRAEAGVLIVPIPKKRHVFAAQFRMMSGPGHCYKTALAVRMVGIPDEDDSEPHECCTTLPPKLSKEEKWPPHCGKSCTEFEEG